MTSHLNLLNTNNTTTYGVRNPGSGFRQAQKYCITENIRIMVDNYIIDVVGTLQYMLEAVDDEGDTILFYLENNTYSMGEPSLTEDGL